ncbi:MAG TPA: hypothetical protein VMV09_07880 [Candidatus Saccharimonadales bacterium]|nr:hypothetical protein [Candidatus Saccharimonadales bacterium]
MHLTATVPTSPPPDPLGATHRLDRPLVVSCDARPVGKSGRDRETSAGVRPSPLAGFPVSKHLDEFLFSLSSVPLVTFDDVAALERTCAAGDVCRICSAASGQSHLVVEL